MDWKLERSLYGFIKLISLDKKKYPHLLSPNEHRVFIGFREFCIERIHAKVLNYRGRKCEEN